MLVTVEVKSSHRLVTSGARFYTALDNCMQRTDQLEVELQRDIESARMFRSGIWSGEAETHVCSLLQITDKVGHSGRQDRAQPRHGLGRDRGQIHAEAVQGLRVPPSDGGRQALPGHGSRHRLPQQAGRWAARQGEESQRKEFSQTESHSIEGLFDVSRRAERVGGELRRAQELSGAELWRGSVISQH